ncbi:MAG: hypothetical protein QM490_01925 [Candidatus Gracilibacteria bacterium]
MENILIQSQLRTTERENLTYRMITNLVKKNIDVFAYNIVDYHDTELNENPNFTNIFSDDKLRSVLKDIKNFNDRNKKVIVLNDLAISYLMNNDYSDALGMIENLMKDKRYNVSFIYSFHTLKNNKPFEGFIKEFDKLYIFKNEEYYDVKDYNISVSEFEKIKKLKKGEYYIKLS